MVPASPEPGELAAVVPDDLADLRPPRPVGARRRLPDLVEGYLWTARAANTRRAYAQDLRAYFLWLDTARVGPRAALRVERPTADAFVAAQSLDGHRPATVRRRVSVVRGFYDYAQDAGACAPPNPFARVRPPRGAAEPRHPGLDLGEARRLLEVAAADRPLAHLAVALGCVLGLRAAEVVALDLADVRRERRRVVLHIQGKGSKEATVAVPTELRAVLARYLRGRGARPGPLLADDAGPLTYPRFYRLVRRLSRAAGLSPRSPHDLRRGTCGGLLDLGVDLRDTQRSLRHSSIQTTIKYDVRRQALGATPSDLLSRRLLHAPRR